jgi:mono/diheme cytochrome c family protein
MLAIVARATAMAAFGVLLADAAAAQDRGDAARGRAFAQEVCTPCHKVVPQQFAQRLAIAPSFDTIAAAPGITQTALQAFLVSSHPTMPNLILEPDEAADVIAYILSLAPPRKN